jgi:hypothetical protein
MSKPIRSAGIVGRDDLVIGVGRERRRCDDVDRQDDLDTLGLGLAEVGLAGLDVVLVEQARAHLVALGCEEGEGHPAADDEAVGRLHEVVDDRELVGDLRAAEHHGIRARWVLGEPLEHVYLGGDQATHGRRQQLGDVIDRRLLAVHDAETVGHEGVGQAGELAANSLAPARLRPCSSRRR